MKKMLKKAMIVLAVLLCFATIVPNRYDKKADAIVPELTIAGGVAAGFGLPILLVGAAAAVAIGGLIGSNWDTINDYGTRVWADLESKGINPAGLVDETNKTVTMSPDLINSAAKAVDQMPTTVQSVGALTAMGSKTTTKYYEGFYDAQVSYTLPNTSLLTNVGSMFTFKIWGTPSDIGSLTLDVYIKTSLYPNGATSSVQPTLVSSDGASKTYRYQVKSGDQYLKKLQVMTTNGNARSVTLSMDYGIPAITTYNTADSFGMTADNVYQRELYANSMLAANQVLTLNDTMDLTNSTLEDVLSVQNNTYDETKTQTGILSNLWSIIKGIPANIAAAGVAASSAINANMDQLWDDAGAIWTGLADTATAIQTDVNAKMGALQDAMSGGIDNVKTGLNDMRLQLGAGIDSLAASMAANMASWGQLTLDGISAGVGSIASGLTDTWTNITTGITEGVGTIMEAVTGGWTAFTSFVTEFPSMMLSIVIPSASDFSMAEKMEELARLLEQKFGSLDDLMAQLRSSFDQTGSIYEIEITLMGRQYKIVPIILKPTIDGARPFLTAAVNLTSLTFLVHRNKKELFK